MKANYRLLILLSTCLLGSCGQQEADSSASFNGHTAPTKATITANTQAREQLKAFDEDDFVQANAGLVARDPALRIEGPDGKLIFDRTAFDFIKGDAPSSVNPSLWRQEQLNNIHGLFKVTEGVYQIRGYDLANMSIIEGKSGWIIVDPLSTTPTARKALDFARSQLGNKPVSAIIFTHSHVDHFGGVLGIISAEEARERHVPIIAPIGFMQESTSENVLAGVTMGRRTGFAYGKWLAQNERGHVGLGLGKTIVMGPMGILAPTVIVDHTPQAMDIDGVKFIFQNVPGSEAPAELTFYLPELKTFCGAEVVSRNMHNIYTLRGAKVRDALAWSRYIDEAIQLFSSADIYFASHHWPIWGNAKIIQFMKEQRDTYKYIHDQTMRMAAQGLTPLEIADVIEMPETLRDTASSRGYYGTTRHNSRGVYQHYFGFFDANPAHLNPLPPEQSSQRYIAMMGGADEVLVKAQQDFDNGDYRWVAELLNQLVYTDPSNQAAVELLARTYDQLGYQAESGPWRDIYLTGAFELRHGSFESNENIVNAKSLIQHTPISSLFDSMATRLIGPKADGVDTTIDFRFTDMNQRYLLWIENAVLHHRQIDASDTVKADVVLKITHELLIKLVLRDVGIEDTLGSKDISLEGSKLKLIRFFMLLEEPNSNFNIVIP